MENSTESTDGPYQSSQDMLKLGFLTGKTHSVDTQVAPLGDGAAVVSAGHESHTGQGKCCLLPWDTWVFPAEAKGGNGGIH